MVKHRVRGYCPATKRYHKNQAVYPTKDAETIRKIKQNAEDSPLLRLPFEIRQMIWKASIGDRLIHIKHYNPAELARLRRHRTNPEATETTGAFRHIECTATITETEAYEASKAQSTSVPAGEDPLCYVQSFESRHSGCYRLATGSDMRRMWDSLFEQGNYLVDEKDRITMCTMLGTSHQVYEEAYRLFWLSNTFSFDDPLSLVEFINSLTRSQKHHFTNLHVSDKLTNHGTMTWEGVLQGQNKKSPLDLLTGLSTLHICSELKEFQIPNTPDAIMINSLERALTSPWHRLRPMPLTKVTIVLNDNRPYLEATRLLPSRSTVLEKSQFAEMIRTSLLDPQEVDRARRDVENKKTAQKEKNKKKKERKLRSMTGESEVADINREDSGFENVGHGQVDAQRSYLLNPRQVPLLWSPESGHEPTFDHPQTSTRQGSLQGPQRSWEDNPLTDSHDPQENGHSSLVNPLQPPYPQHQLSRRGQRLLTRDLGDFEYEEANSGGRESVSFEQQARQEQTRQHFDALVAAREPYYYQEHGPDPTYSQQQAVPRRAIHTLQPPDALSEAEWLYDADQPVNEGEPGAPEQSNALSEDQYLYAADQPVSEEEPVTPGQSDAQWASDYLWPPQQVKSLRAAHTAQQSDTLLAAEHSFNTNQSENHQQTAYAPPQHDFSEFPEFPEFPEFSDLDALFLTEQTVIRQEAAPVQRQYQPDLLQTPWEPRSARHQPYSRTNWVEAGYNAAVQPAVVAQEVEEIAEPPALSPLRSERDDSNPAFWDGVRRQEWVNSNSYHSHNYRE